ncbi:MAG: alpha/beta fold hydrolase, partial [Gammaproteobacteria bacterium]|nr:alpha/beta fold hydrolase [Gammaproteobacteria bacterium]
MGKQKKNHHVVVLHGLGRSWLSMWWLSRALKQAGFQVHNVDYPSTRHNIQWLADKYVKPVVQRLQHTQQPLHFVTHSLGGILVRQYLQSNTLPAGSRVVMLAPPNHGSEVADKLRNWKSFQWLDGPAGQQLGTGSNSVPNQLEPLACEIGIVAGDNERYLPTSGWIPGKNDGLVSVESARLKEMKDFIVVHCGHTMIMNDAHVIRQVI